MNIPEPVLRGLLDKFQQDEEQAVRRLKAKYVYPVVICVFVCMLFNEIFQS